MSLTNTGGTITLPGTTNCSFIAVQKIVVDDSVLAAAAATVSNVDENLKIQKVAPSDSLASKIPRQPQQ